MKIINTAIFSSLLFFSASSYSVEVIPLFGLRGGGEFVDVQTNKNTPWKVLKYTG